MLGALFEKFGAKKEEIEIIPSFYTPKDVFLRDVRDASYNFIDNLDKAVLVKDRKQRVREFSTELSVFARLVKKWEDKTSPVVTERYLSTFLSRSNNSNKKRLLSVDVFRLQYAVVNNYGLLVDKLLGMIKRGNFKGTPTSIAITSVWSGQEGIPSDERTTSNVGLSGEGKYAANLMAFATIVSTIRRMYPTVTSLRTELVLNDIQYGEPFDVKYQTYNAQTRMNENATVTHFKAVRGTPNVSLTVQFLAGDEITFDITSGNRMALTSFAGQLSDLAKSYDRLTSIAQENVRTLTPNGDDGENVWEDLKKIIFSTLPAVDGVTPKIALTDEDASPTIENKTETTVNTDNVSVSESKDSNVDSTTEDEDQPQDDVDTLNEQAESKDLTTDGADVQVTTP